MYECYLNIGSRCNSHQNNAVIIRFDVGQLFSIHTTGECRTVHVVKGMIETPIYFTSSMFMQVYVGQLSLHYEALSVEASKLTTAEEIVSCIVERLNLTVIVSHLLSYYRLALFTIMNKKILVSRSLAGK